jgi:hypothetical protein
MAVEGMLASLATSTFALEIGGDRQGRRFALRARPPTLRYLEAQLRSAYGPVQVLDLPPGEDPVRHPVDPAHETARAVLRLEQLPALSLRTFRDGDFAQADPMRGILGAFSDFGEGEWALAQLVLRRAPRGWARPYLHLAGNPMDRAAGSLPLGAGGSLLMLGLLAAGLFLFLLGVTSLAAGRWALGMPALLGLLPVLIGWRRLSNQVQLAQAAEPETVRRKVNSPAFEFQLRLAAWAPTGAQARGRLLQLVTAFQQFNTGAGNALKPDGDGVRCDDMSHGWRRTWYGRPLDILSAAEIAALWHLPLGEDVALVERTLSRAIRPLPASVAPADGGALIGAIAGDPARPPAYLSPDALRKHKLLVGKTQKGKSTLMAQLALAHIHKGDGVFFIDPHGKAVRELLGLIPRERVDDVLFLDFGGQERVIGWNPLQAIDQQARRRIVSNFIYAAERVWSDFWGPRMEDALRHALEAITEANMHIAADHPERQLVIADVISMLSLGLFKTTVLDRYVDSLRVQRWFRQYYEGLYAAKRQDVVNPVQTKIHRFTGTQNMDRIFGQSQSTIDFDDMVRRRRIVLVNLDVGEIGARDAGLLGALLLTYLEMAVRSQAPRGSTSLAVIVDEFQQIPFDYQTLLAELQKMGANFTMGTQSLAQLDAMDRTLCGAVLGNVDSLFVFQVSALDAETLLPELVGREDPRRQGRLQVDDLISQDDFECYVRSVRDHRVVPVYQVHTQELPPRNAAVEEQILRRLPRYTRSIGEVEHILEQHQRIWYTREYEEYRQARRRAENILRVEELARQIVIRAAPPGVAGSMDQDKVVLTYEAIHEAARRVAGERGLEVEEVMAGLDPALKEQARFSAGGQSIPGSHPKRTRTRNHKTGAGDATGQASPRYARGDNLAPSATETADDGERDFYGEAAEGADERR